MQYAPCSTFDLLTFNTWLTTLSSPFDSFLEDHILASQFYKIIIADQEVGAFALHQNTLLTHFYLIGPAQKFGQQAFAQVVQQYSITAAFVPTYDEFFLSHALDNYTDLKKQAYFFAEGAAKLEPFTPNLHYRLAGLTDAAALRAISADFLDKHETRIQNGEIYVGLRNDVLIAIGVIERSKLLSGYASIGMFTHEAHRQ